MTSPPAALETTRCYVCGDGDAVPFAEEGGFTVVRCATCRLLYVNPRPAEGLISAAHRTGEHRTAEGTLAVTTRFSTRAVRAARHRIRRAFPELRPDGTPRRWLDLGAGNGEVLLAVRQLAGPDAVLAGVEPNAHKRRHAAVHGVDLAASLEEIDARPFDTISLVNVFSHLPNPPETLATLAARLTPGGSLLVVTGNAAALRHRDEYPGPLDLPDHLSFVDRALIERVAAKAHLRIVTCHAYREDTLRALWTRLGRRRDRARAPWRLPYSSPFRSLWVRVSRAGT